MKLNGTQGTYHSVPQNVQSEEAEASKSIASQDNVVENGQNAKLQPSPSKEQTDDSSQEEEKKKPMSPLRKFCFVLSLLQCVLFIVAFGWLIPCKIPRQVDNSQFSHNWEYNFYGEDIVTNLAVSSPSFKPVAVVFGYSAVNNNSVAGVRALNAFDGTVLWEQNVIGHPKGIVCNEVDVNNDHIPDCILTNDLGQIIALDMRSGELIWSLHSHHTNRSINSKVISSPLVGKPCHSDSQPFIYAAVKDESGLYFFITVSAETGQIREIYNLTECVTMPDNIMFRNVAVVDEESDTLLELVMTCANREGEGIIFTTDVNELCSNQTFKSFNEIAFKLAFTEKSDYPMTIKPFSTLKKDVLVALTHSSKIKFFSDDTQEHTEFSSKDKPNLKDFTVGHFTNNSMANVAIISSDNSGNSSVIFLLDSNGHAVWSIPVENGTATAIYTVQKAFNLVDGILLKIVSVLSDDEIQHLNTTDHAPGVVHFEEKYAILECSETGALKILSSEYFQENCPNSDCYPKVFNTDHTAVVTDVDSDGVDELVHFSRKPMRSSLEQSITIKLVRLSNFLPAKSCSSPCHC